MSDNENFKDTCGSAGCSASDCATCGCECGGSGQLPSTITLTMEDDTEVTCAIITVFPVQEQEYIAVLPVNEQGQPISPEVYLYKFTRTESGDPMLDNIDDDDEYAAAADMFNKVLEKAKEDEMNNVPIQ